MNTKNLNPFDLGAALKGEPVMLRNGNKAFVRHHEAELTVRDDNRIWGLEVHDDVTASFISWTLQGRYSDENNYRRDIIGMYPKTRIINGFEVPAPETEEPESSATYFAPNVLIKWLYSGLVWDDCGWDKHVLSRGLVFLSKEDAIANAKAMLGINPYEESEE